MPHPLTALKWWVNEDKHIALNPVWGTVREVTLKGPVEPVARDQGSPIIEHDAEIAWAKFDRPNVYVDIETEFAVVLPLWVPATEDAYPVPLSYLGGIHQFIAGWVLPRLMPFVRPVE